MTKKFTKWNMISAFSMVVAMIIGITLLCTAGKFMPWIYKDGATAIVEQNISNLGSNMYTQRYVDYIPLDKSELNSLVMCTGFMGGVSIGSVVAQLGFYLVKWIKKLTKKDEKENIRIGKSA